MTILRGTVLSHTAMGGTKFCTNIAVQDPQTGAWMQLRPRLPPNERLDLTSFGQSVATMQKYWQPGVQVDIDWIGPPAPANRRATHPEDYLCNGKTSTLYSNCLTPAQFLFIAQQFQAASVQMLFPPIVWQGNRKGYVEDGQILAHSVGYVACERVTLISGGAAEVLTKAGESILVPVKDGAFLAVPVGTRYADVLVRFSLANKWGGKDNNIYVPERCFLMLSHVVL